MKDLYESRVRRGWILSVKHPLRWVPALKGRERTASQLSSSTGVAPSWVPWGTADPCLGTPIAATRHPHLAPAAVGPGRLRLWGGQQIKVSLPHQR